MVRAQLTTLPRALPSLTAPPSPQVHLWDLRTGTELGIQPVLSRCLENKSDKYA